MISSCAGRNFTQCEFALLLLDLLDLETRETCEGAFALLESLHIGPVGGWAKADPTRILTPQEMEEVRCSASLAADQGLISASSSVIVARLNRFCEELKASLEAVRESGIIRGKTDVPPITGYQGGTERVASPPF
ncbi:MAG: hypothetical protein JRJ26_08270 [Deltaproteobacteria bacterium]|nr:hypothetical protein [Deltaproteobacteria bacterium]